MLGGDHSVALGSLVGMAKVRGAGGVVWVDAHGDVNTPETSPSGNVHGMVLAAALGLAGDAFARDGWPLPAVEPGKLALVGVRSLDDGERELLQRIDAKVFTMSDVDRIGHRAVHARGARPRGRWRRSSTSRSTSTSSIRSTRPASGRPCAAGSRTARRISRWRSSRSRGTIDSMDVVEVNPILDRENATGQLAVELVASALGARIL